MFEFLVLLLRTLAGYFIFSYPIIILDRKFNFKDKLVVIAGSKFYYHFFLFILFFTTMTLLEYLLQRDLTESLIYNPIILCIGIGLMKH